MEEIDISKNGKSVHKWRYFSCYWEEIEKCAILWYNFGTCIINVTEITCFKNKIGNEYCYVI